MGDTSHVLAITSDDTMFHVGEPAALLAHLYPGGDPAGVVLAEHGRTSTTAPIAARAPAGTDPPAMAGTLEIYDGSGRRLTVVSRLGGRRALVPAGAGDADPDHLVERIDRVLDRMRAYVRRHPGEVVGPEAVPGARGPLPAVLALLDGYGSAPTPPPDPGTLAGGVISWVSTAVVSLRSGLPHVLGRIRTAATRLPLPGRTPPLGPVDPGSPQPPGSIPHTGGWFHNLMHRISG